MGQKIKLYGHVLHLRDLGKVRFVILRTFDGVAQVVLKKNSVSEDIWKRFEELGYEYFVEVVGEKVESKIAKLGWEVHAEDLKIVAKSKTVPIDLADKTTTEFPTRLRYRYLDIRREPVRSILKVRASVVQAAREFLVERGFVELHFPIICGTASEGGAELFPVKYFDRQAYLVQSAQLYKQSAIPVFGKVFTVGPSFRAEKSRTKKHLTEFWQIDVEAALISKEELMKLQFELVKHIYARVAERNEKELSALGVKLEVPESYDVLSYEEALEVIRKKGLPIEWGEDFGADEERALCESFDKPFFVTEFPEKVVAFYYMVDDDDPRYAHRVDMYGWGSYGVEWSSGGLREHRPDRLRKRMKEKGLNPENFAWYLDMLEYGFPPHAGFGMGVERLLYSMLKLERVHEAVLYPRTPDVLEP